MINLVIETKDTYRVGDLQNTNLPDNYGEIYLQAKDGFKLSDYFSSYQEEEITLDEAISNFIDQSEFNDDVEVKNQLKRDIKLNIQ